MGDPGQGDSCLDKGRVGEERRGGEAQRVSALRQGSKNLPRQRVKAKSQGKEPRQRAKAESQGKEPRQRANERGLWGGGSEQGRS